MQKIIWKYFLVLFFVLKTSFVLSQVDKPMVFIELSDKSVTVGEALKLKVEVVVPTWLLGAPDFPQLNIEGAIAILSEERAQNVRKVINDETWSGISRVYLIYPQEPKNYSIVNEKIKVVYSLGGINKSPDTYATIPEIRFKTTIPDAARELEHFISTTRLKIKQTFDKSLKELRVGDSFKRTIRIDAANTMAMFIPPILLDTLRGLSIYANPPIVENNVSNREGFTGGYRVESVEYFIQDSGNFELPEIEIKWWNLRTRKISSSILPSIKFFADTVEVSKNELAIPTDSTIVGNNDSKETNSLLSFPIVGILLVIIFLYFINAKYSIFKKIQDYFIRRKIERLNSENTYFKNFEVACNKGDLKNIVSTYNNWFRKLSISIIVDKHISLKEFEIGTEIYENYKLLNSILYGDNNKVHRDFNSKEFYANVMKARKTVIDRVKQSGRVKTIPLLNPPTKLTDI